MNIIAPLLVTFKLVAFVCYCIALDWHCNALIIVHFDGFFCLLRQVLVHPWTTWTDGKFQLSNKSCHINHNFPRLKFNSGHLKVKTTQCLLTTVREGSIQFFPVIYHGLVQRVRGFIESSVKRIITGCVMSKQWTEGNWMDPFLASN